MAAGVAVGGTLFVLIPNRYNIHLKKIEPMKRIHLLLCLLVLAPTAWGQVRFSEGSTDKIRQLAEQQQKLVFIDLTADWCGYCRWMDSEVYAQPEVGNYMNAHFVSVRYDVDQPTGGELLKRYGNGGIPLLLIFDRQGELLGRIEGASPANELLANLRKIVQTYQRQSVVDKLRKRE